jgi:aspartyl-tRNA(Asn)/glutamyl-tRNA(Gln) amidotransferase subunit C
MPIITTDEVRHIANLARLEFGEAEIQHFTTHLTQILDYISKLNELDTADVPPTSHVIEIRNVMKDDVIKPSYEREVVLANAPAAEAGHFEVPKVIEQ